MLRETATHFEDDEVIGCLSFRHQQCSYGKKMCIEKAECNSRVKVKTRGTDGSHCRRSKMKKINEGRKN